MNLRLNRRCESAALLLATRREVDAIEDTPANAGLINRMIDRLEAYKSAYERFGNIIPRRLWKR